MATIVYLNALRAFEASARHQSFSAAAAELSVTPAAVGQLVRGLEEWLGAPLFYRSTNGRTRLILTEVAQFALPDIRAGFDKLSLGLDLLKESSANGVLTVTISPAFAAKWLLPRIDKFQAAWPETDVRLDTNLKPVDLGAQNIDIGVRYGAGVWPGLISEKLMDEEIYPVCSPSMLLQPRALNEPHELIHEILIHDLSMGEVISHHAGVLSWETWFQKAGVVEVATKRGMQINNSAAVLQAAIEGQGIALARSVMAHDDLAAGRLIRLCPQVKVTSALAYYIVYRAERSNLPRLVVFRDWLLSEASSTVKI